MSHFYAVVLVPKNALVPADPTNKPRWKKGGQVYVKHFIEHQMERYSERRKVDKYDRDCSCIGWDAKMDARKKADGVLTIEEAKEILEERTPKELPEVQAVIDKDGHAFDLSPELEEVYDKLWNEILQPREEAEQTFCEAHPMHGKPDPECDECAGTGTYRSTYNPESKWDWCRVGGRWACVIQKKKWKSDDNGFNFNDDCESLHLNTMNVEEILKDWEPTDAPLVIITPDGEWHERGEMGMFGMFRCAPHDVGSWRDAAKKSTR